MSIQANKHTKKQKKMTKNNQQKIKAIKIRDFSRKSQSSMFPFPFSKLTSMSSLYFSEVPLRHWSELTDPLVYFSYL